MSSLEIVVSEVEYDIYGKCCDLMVYIKQKNPNQMSEKQMKGVAQLTNQLIQFLKEYNASNLLTQPEYHDILYIAKNDLKSILQGIQEERFQFQKIKIDLEHKINQQSEIIEKLTKESKDIDKQKDKINQEYKALKDILEYIQVNEDQIKEQLRKEIQNLSWRNEKLNNEVIQLTKNLNLKEEKIKKQDGEIKNLQLNLESFRNNKNQDRENKIFNEYHILHHKTQMKNKTSELYLQKHSNQKQNNEEDGNDQSENKEEQNPQLIENLQELKIKIENDISNLQWLSIMFCLSIIGAFVIFQIL